jgi:hypothetical protein
MTASRSFAPARSPLQDQDSAPPPVFPLLPFAFTAYAEHCSRDVADHVGRMARAGAGSDERWGAEEALGLHMLTEMNQAFFSLVWAPFGAAINRTRIDDPRP